MFQEIQSDIYLAEFLKTSLTKSEVPWVKWSQKAGLLSRRSSNEEEGKENKNERGEGK